MRNIKYVVTWKNGNAYCNTLEAVIETLNYFGINQAYSIFYFNPISDEELNYIKQNIEIKKESE